MKKKIILTAVVTLVLAFAMVGVASADGGPHGGYTPTTDACAGCHRAHTAAGARLLIVPVGELCMSCHGSTATGADTNVEDGLFQQRDPNAGDAGEGTDGGSLRGGGFVNVVMNSGLTGAANAAVTSIHTYDGLTAGTVWGNGAIGSGAGLAGFNLECTNCHDPHGNGNYRILRPIPRDSGAAAVVNVTDEAVGSKLYTIADAGGLYFGEGYAGFGQPLSVSTTPMTVQYRELSDWCAQCHTRYLAGVESATTDSGDAIFAYRHMIADTFNEGGDCTKCHGVAFVNPPPITFNNGQWRHDVECMTCHVAHGTSADMTTDGPYSGLVEWPDGSATPTGDARSSLLRVDGRGTCQGCHWKSPVP